MNDLRLVRLPSGRWILLAVPASQHVAFKAPAPREAARAELVEARRALLLDPLPAAGGAR